MKIFCKFVSLFLLMASHCIAFDIVQIPSLGGAVFVGDINNSNIIVGASNAPSQAFKYDLNRNILTDLSSIPGIGIESEASGINAHGDIVGNNLTTLRSYFLPANANSAQTLPLPSIPQLIGSQVTKINDCKIISGGLLFPNEFDPTNPNIPRPMVFIFNKGMIDLGTPQGLSNGLALDTNENNQVIGFSFNTPENNLQATVWKIDSCTFSTAIVDDQSLINLGPTFVSLAFANNDLGQVVGLFVTNDAIAHAFLWSKESEAEEIDLSSLGATNAKAGAINNFGTVAGDYLDSNGVFHAFAWRQDTGPVDLGVSGSLVEVTGINDAGVVIANVDGSAFAIFTNNLE